MNEENNRKGPGVFYAVVGVATLVVAIIGATFAYFSASNSTTNDVINGRTLNINNTELGIEVTKVNFDGATVNTNLAPALIGTGIANPDALTEANIQAMLTAKCEEANKYTGCHVWKVVARNANTQDAIAHANLWLNLEATATNKEQWGYAVFKATEANGSNGGVTLTGAQYATVPTGTGLRANHDDLVTAVTGKTLDMHNDAALAANTPVTYYVMVFLNDNTHAQNVSGTPGENESNAIGSYVGSVLFEAMGGEVRASFSAS